MVQRTSCRSPAPARWADLLADMTAFVDALLADDRGEFSYSDPVPAALGPQVAPGCRSARLAVGEEARVSRATYTLRATTNKGGDRWRQGDGFECWP